MAQASPQIAELSEEESRAELARLAETLGAANKAYHQDDAPEISDADYDALKRRNAEIEEPFAGKPRRAAKDLAD